MNFKQKVSMILKNPKLYDHNLRYELQKLIEETDLKLR